MNNNIQTVDYHYRGYYFLFDPAKFEVKIYKENQGLELVDTFSGYYSFPCFLKGAFETWCETWVNNQIGTRK